MNESANGFIMDIGGVVGSVDLNAIALGEGERCRKVRMVDVVMPTTDGRTVTLPRYVEPKQDVSTLLWGAVKP